MTSIGRRLRKPRRARSKGPDIHRNPGGKRRQGHGGRRPQWLLVVAVLIGLAASLALLTKPTRAGFAEDPLLRFGAFGAQPAGPATDVDCGSVLANLRRSAAPPVEFYSVARDSACHDEAVRRAAAATGGAAVMSAVTVLALAARTRAAS